MPLFDATLKCPACGGRNVHFSSVVVRVAPDDDYQIVEYVFPGQLERFAGDLGAVEPGPLTSSECRGGGIEVRYDCESCPHRWGVRQDFHKGSIYSDTFALPIREDRIAELPSVSVENDEGGEDVDL